MKIIRLAKKTSQITPDELSNGITDDPYVTEPIKIRAALQRATDKNYWEVFMRAIENPAVFTDKACVDYIAKKINYSNLHELPVIEDLIYTGLRNPETAEFIKNNFQSESLNTVRMTPFDRAYLQEPEPVNDNPDSTNILHDLFGKSTQGWYQSAKVHGFIQKNLKYSIRL